MYEVLLTFGVIMFGFTFCETFFRGIDQFDDLIIAGDFDRLLLRPRGILFQVFCNDICFFKFARFFQAIAVLVIAIINLDIIWSIDKILTLIFSF